MSRVNFRLLFVHFIAMWLFMHAVKLLSFLYDTDILEAAINHDDRIFDAENFFEFNLIMIFSALSGLVAGFLVSLFISIKRGWYWLNSLITLLILFLLMKLDLLGWKYLKSIFLLPGILFESTSAKLFVNGVVLLVISMVLFFWKKIQGYISGTLTLEAKPISSSS